MGARHAKLAVGAAATLTIFLFEARIRKPNTKQKRPQPSLREVPRLPSWPNQIFRSLQLPVKVLKIDSNYSHKLLYINNLRFYRRIKSGKSLQKSSPRLQNSCRSAVGAELLESPERRSVVSGMRPRSKAHHIRLRILREHLLQRPFLESCNRKALTPVQCGRLHQ